MPPPGWTKPDGESVFTPTNGELGNSMWNFNVNIGVSEPKHTWYRSTNPRVSLCRKWLQSSSKTLTNNESAQVYAEFAKAAEK